MLTIQHHIKGRYELIETTTGKKILEDVTYAKAYAKYHQMKREREKVTHGA